MPLYVHELLARVVREAPPDAGGTHPLTPTQVEAVADDVARVLLRRLEAAASPLDEAGITGRNRPASLGD